MSGTLPDNLIFEIATAAGIELLGTGDKRTCKCPFHDDKNPSAFLRGSMNCFSCTPCGLSLGAKAFCEKLSFPWARFVERNGSVGKDQQGKIVAEYDYRDEKGQLLFQVARKQPKGFFHRRPEGAGGYINDLKGVRVVLYRLPELIAGMDAAVDGERRTFVVEGEKDTEALRKVGLLSTTNPMGAGRWRDEFTDQLKGAGVEEVVILPDNDDPGEDHARGVARSCLQAGLQVKVLQLPGLPPKGDVSDWLASGGTVEELLKLAAETPVITEVEALDDDDSDEEQEGGEAPPQVGGKESHADAIVALVEEAGIELFHTPDSETFATIPFGEHKEHWPLKSRAFRRWLSRQFYGKFKKAPSAQSLSDAMNVLEGRAFFDGPVYPVFIRLAGDEKAIYIDLANEKWECIKVTAEGWEVLPHPPVKFRRSRGAAPLPYPVRGGSIEELRPLVNLSSEEDWILFVSWLIGALFPRGPYPVMVLGGPHGSAKSTRARLAKRLVDPNTAEIRALPRNEHDLIISASNTWAMAFDNVSVLQDWMSDALCRLATGGGFSTRELFTDSDEIIFDAQRPTILNGIEEIVTRGDLLDRSILLVLPKIPKERRKSERAFWADFDKVHARVLGALLDALSVALRNLPTTVVASPPRMADFSILMTAAEPAFGWRPGSFIEAYTKNLTAGNESVLEASPVAPLVVALAEGPGWNGTASQLLEALNAKASEQTKRLRGWPGSPRAATNALRRLSTNLLEAGIEVLLGDREPGSGRRLITIRRCPQPCVTSVTSVTSPGEEGVTQGVTQEPDPSLASHPSPGACDACDDSDEAEHTFGGDEDEPPPGGPRRTVTL